MPFPEVSTYQVDWDIDYWLFSLLHRKTGQLLIYNLLVSNVEFQ